MQFAATWTHLDRHQDSMTRLSIFSWHNFKVTVGLYLVLWSRSPSLSLLMIYDSELWPSVCIVPFRCIQLFDQCMHFWDSLGQTLNHVMVCLRDCPAQGMFHRLSEGRLGWKHVGGASTEDWFRSLENPKTYSLECALFRVTSCCITIIWHDAMK